MCVWCFREKADREARESYLLFTTMRKCISVCRGCADGLLCTGVARRCESGVSERGEKLGESPNPNPVLSFEVPLGRGRR